MSIFDKLFHRTPGRNKELNDRLQTMKADMENNYKDAAQLDFKKAKKLYEDYLAGGKVSDKEKAYYDKEMEEAVKALSHFTHFEGPGTGLYNSQTTDGLLQIGKPIDCENKDESY